MDDDRSTRLGRRLGFGEGSGHDLGMSLKRSTRRGGGGRRSGLGLFEPLGAKARSARVAEWVDRPVKVGGGERQRASRSGVRGSGGERTAAGGRRTEGGASEAYYSSRVVRKAMMASICLSSMCAPWWHAQPRLLASARNFVSSGVWMTSAHTSGGTSRSQESSSGGGSLGR